MKHTVRRISGGSNESSWIQPICLCGWAGTKEYAYNDYQHTNLKEQEAKHIKGKENDTK